MKVLWAHPVVELWGELVLETANSSFTVVSLYEGLGYQWCAVPQLLKVMELAARRKRLKCVTFIFIHRHSRCLFALLDWFCYVAPHKADTISNSSFLLRRFRLTKTLAVASELLFLSATDGGDCTVKFTSLVYSRSNTCIILIYNHSSCVSGQALTLTPSLNDSPCTERLMCFTPKQSSPPEERTAANKWAGVNLSPADLNFSPQGDGN